MCEPLDGESSVLKEAYNYRFHLPVRFKKIKGKLSSYADTSKSTVFTDSIEIQVTKPEPIDYLDKLMPGKDL